MWISYFGIRVTDLERSREFYTKVFARKGLRATITDIAKEAGVSQGLAYRYFPSKEAIFHTLLRQMLPDAGIIFRLLGPNLSMERGPA